MPRQADGSSQLVLPKVEGKRSKFDSLDELVAYHIDKKGCLPCKLVAPAKKASRKESAKKESAKKASAKKGSAKKASAKKEKNKMVKRAPAGPAWHQPSATRAMAESSLANKVRCRVTEARLLSWGGGAPVWLKRLLGAAWWRGWQLPMRGAGLLGAKYPARW